MISRRTGMLIWSSVLIPISVLIAIKTFRFRIPLPPFFFRQPPLARTSEFWEIVEAVTFVGGALSLMPLPFSLIHDFAERKMKLQKRPYAFNREID
jgi:hypothetical protein